MKNVILFSVIILLSIGCNHTHVPGESEAYALLRGLLKEKLENVAHEMEFPNALDYDIECMPDTSFVFTSYFDFKNDLGIKERQRYKACIKYKGGRWQEYKNWDVIYFKALN